MLVTNHKCEYMVNPLGIDMLELADKIESVWC